MSGHSKWAQIKHKKAITDARRGKIFSKLAQVITLAAREGPDHSMNSKLRDAIDRARAMNMPSVNIERAISRGAGKGDGAGLEEVIYEAFGPGGVAIIIEGITDNKNRTTSEIKHTLSEYDGQLAGQGAVRWMFDQKTVTNEEGKSSLEFVAKQEIEISDPETKTQLERLFEALDDHPDVQEIYSNAKLTSFTF